MHGKRNESRDTAQAMSEENVELALRAFNAVNDRDLDAYLALADEEIEVVSRIAAIEGPLRGLEGVRRWWESWFAAFPDYRLELVETQDDGEIVLIGFRALGHGAGSDLPFEDVAWYASRWRKGKCVWWRGYRTHEEALETTGLSE